jgi:HK97 family phage portal protein
VPNFLERAFPRLQSTASLIREANELRSISVNQTIAAAWRNFSMGTASASGVLVDERSAATSPTIAAAVRLIRAVGSSLPLHIYEPGSNGGSRRLMDHPADRLLNSAANSYMTASTFRATLLDALLVWGRAYAWCVRNGRADPMALFPLNPNTKVEWQPNENVVGGLEPVYKTARQVGNYRQDLELKQDAIIAIVIHAGQDGTTPVSPTRTNAELIGLELALGEYGARIFGSTSAGFGMVAKSSKPLGSPQTEEIRDRLTNEHEGLLNAHKLTVLGPDLTLERIAPVSKDVQNVEMRRAVRAFLAGTMGTPNLLIGADSDQPIAKGQYSEITLAFVSYALVPILKCVEQAMEQTLLFSSERQRGVSIKHELRGLLAGSPDDESIVLTRNVQAGVMTVNEARERLDLPRIAGGDSLITRDDETPETRSAQSTRRKAVQHDAIIRIAQEQPLVMPAPVVNVNVSPTPVTVQNTVEPAPVTVHTMKEPKRGSKLIRDPKTKLILGVEPTDE